jgi:outer membrane protein TolC
MDVKTIGFAAAVLLSVAGGNPVSAQTDSVNIKLDTTVTLADALSRVDHVNPDVARGIANLEYARSAQRVAVGNYLPTVVAAATASDANRATPSVPLEQILVGQAYSAGVIASLDLFTAGRRGAERRQAAAQRAAADASLIDRRYGARLTAEIVFFDVLRAEDLIAVGRARVAQDVESLAQTQHRLDAGTTTRSDVLRAGVELAAGKEALLQAEADLASSAYELGRVTGLNGAVGASAADSALVRPLALSPQELVALIVGEGPTVKAAEATFQSAVAATSAARKEYFPTLNVTGGYSWVDEQAVRYNTEPINGVYETGGAWQVRLGFTYPIFNGFQREDAITRAKADADAAQVARDDERRAARSAAERGLANLTVAGDRIQLSDEAVAQAKEDLRVQNSRYNVGASTILDQLTSEAAVVQAETDLANARFDYGVARATLEALAGRTL